MVAAASCGKVSGMRLSQFGQKRKFDGSTSTHASGWLQKFISDRFAALQTCDGNRAARFQALR